MAQVEIDLSQVEQPFYPMGSLQQGEYPWIVKAMEKAGFDFQKNIKWEYDAQFTKVIYTEEEKENEPKTDL